MIFFKPVNYHIHAYRKSLIFVTRWYCIYNSSTNTNAFFKVISDYMTVQARWKVTAWGLKFQLPKQTVIIQIASQGVFTKCSSFQISHLVVTVKFIHFCGYLQLDHPVTCENIKCYPHIQIITRIKCYNFLITCSFL